MASHVTPNLLYAAVTALLGYLLFGYNTGFISGGILLISQEIDLTWWQKDVVVTITVLLATLGVALAGRLADHLGRRWVMILASLAFILGAFMCVAASGYKMLVFGRGLLGLGVGFSFVVVPVYLSEAAPQELRGQLVGLTDLSIVLGQLAAGLMNASSDAVPWLGWRQTCAVAVIVGLVQLLMLIRIPESPRWLAAQGDAVGAKEVLMSLREGQDGKGTVEERVSHELEGIREAVASEAKAVGDIWCSQRVARSMQVGIILHVLNQLTGINSVMYYGGTILQAAGFSESWSLWLSSMCTAAQVVGVSIQVSLIDTCGRRFTGLLSLMGVTLTLILLASSFLGMRWYPGCKACEWFAVFSIMSYLVAFGCGLSGVTYVLNAEIHPLQIRAQCCALAGLVSWILNLVVGTSFPVILRYVGAEYAFFSYAGVGFLGFIWAWHYLPETAHVPLERIDTLFEDPYPKQAWALCGADGLAALSYEGEGEALLKAEATDIEVAGLI